MKNKIDLNKLLNNPASLSEKFHQKTKIKYLSKEIPSTRWPESWKTVYFKGYSRMKEIILPKPTLPNKISLKEVLIKRRSSREFLPSPLSIDKLSSLLYYAAGLKNKKIPSLTGRFYPSGGARYPLETYVVSLNIKSLPKGLYHYYLKNHSLEKLLTFDKFEMSEYFNQPWMANSSCLIVITAVFKRTTIKYGDRGYRYVLIETGHLGQNFYLIASAFDIGCCAIGGFVDDNLNKLLDVDGVNESVVYVLAIGNRF